MDIRDEIRSFTVEELTERKVEHKTECKKGHPLSPSTTYVYKRPGRQAQVKCKVCANEKAKAWRLANPERYAELQLKAQATVKAKRVIATTEQRREKNLRKCHGIDLAQFTAMLDAQQWRCQLCSVELVLAAQPDVEGKHRGYAHTAQVDHCHSTNVIRGALCLKCNMGLGYFNDNPEALENAAAYIRKHRDGKA